jgi:hypothetical protein
VIDLVKPLLGSKVLDVLNGDLDPRVRNKALVITGPGPQVVDNHDAGDVLTSQQPLNQVRAKKSQTAGYNNLLQVTIPLSSRSAAIPNAFPSVLMTPELVLTATFRPAAIECGTDAFERVTDGK